MLNLDFGVIRAKGQVFYKREVAYCYPCEGRGVSGEVITLSHIVIV